MQRNKQNKVADATDAERCMWSSAGSLHCCIVCMTRLYMLHKIERNSKNVEKPQTDMKTRVAKDTKAERCMWSSAGSY